MKKYAFWAVLSIAASLVGCATQQVNVPRTPSTQQGGKSNSTSLASIPYNPEKIAPRQVASQAAAVLNSYGYKAAEQQLTTMTFGEGGKATAAPARDDSFICVVTEFQKPTEGSEMKEWRYKVTVSSLDTYHVLSLDVEVKSSGTILGMPVDTAISFWEPPDMRQIHEAIQHRLQDFGTK